MHNRSVLIPKIYVPMRSVFLSPIFFFGPHLFVKFSLLLGHLLSLASPFLVAGCYASALVLPKLAAMLLLSMSVLSPMPCPCPSLLNCSGACSPMSVTYVSLLLNHASDGANGRKKHVFATSHFAGPMRRSHGEIYLITCRERPIVALARFNDNFFSSFIFCLFHVRYKLN